MHQREVARTQLVRGEELPVDARRLLARLGSHVEDAEQRVRQAIFYVGLVMAASKFSFQSGGRRFARFSNIVRIDALNPERPR